MLRDSPNAKLRACYKESVRRWRDKYVALSPAAQQLTQNSGSAAGFRPAGELTAEVGGVHQSGEEHGGVKDRFIADEFEQAGEVHARMLAWMAS